MDNILQFLTPKEDTYYLNKNSSIRQFLEKLDRYKFTVMPLIDDEGNYYGTISEGDVLRYIKNNCDFNISAAENTKLCDIEKYREYIALSICSSSETMMNLALDQNFVPIIDDRNKYIGIIKRKDIIREMLKNK